MTRYLRHLILYFALALSALAATGWLLDPFGYFRLHGLRPGWLLGDGTWGDERISKDMAIAALEPRTLIAGTSRVRYGFDVDDPALIRHLGPAYNLGLGGASLDELDVYIRNALDGNALRTLVIGLDFGAFSRDNTGFTTAAPDNGGLPGLHLPRPVRQLGQALWSSDILRVAGDVAREPPRRTLQGVGNPHDMASRIARMGHRALSHLSEKRIARRLEADDQRLHPRHMATLGRLLDATCARRLTIKLFISPLHVRQLVLFKATGNWPRFLAWKTGLADLADRGRAAGCQVSLTDFSRLSRQTSEPFPALGDKVTAMRWYWESSHYKAALGRLLIQRLHDDPAAPADFGHDLTAESAAPAAAAADAELERYCRDHPELLEEIRALIPGPA